MYTAYVLKLFKSLSYQQGFENLSENGNFYQLKKLFRSLRKDWKK